MARITRVTGVCVADENHQVLTIETSGGDKHAYRRRPCEQCPWRTDAPVGAFPAEAYRHSARTAYDMAEQKFSCHMSGRRNPQTCAGFLLKGSDHNLSVRLALSMGKMDLDQVSSDVDLYDGYRAMAEANDVDPDDPVLAPCR